MDGGQESHAVGQGERGRQQRRLDMQARPVEFVGHEPGGQTHHGQFLTQGLLLPGFARCAAHGRLSPGTQPRLAALAVFQPDLQRIEKMPARPQKRQPHDLAHPLGEAGRDAPGQHGLVAFGQSAGHAEFGASVLEAFVGLEEIRGNGVAKDHALGKAGLGLGPGLLGQGRAGAGRRRGVGKKVVEDGLTGAAGVLVAGVEAGLLQKGLSQQLHGPGLAAFLIVAADFLEQQGIGIAAPQPALVGQNGGLERLAQQARPAGVGGVLLQQPELDDGFERAG